MSKSIADLRATLFEALEAVKAGTLDLEKARAVNEISKTIIDSAKVEVAYLAARGDRDASPFLEHKTDDKPALPEPGNGVVAITRHVLRG